MPPANAAGNIFVLPPCSTMTPFTQQQPATSTNRASIDLICRLEARTHLYASMQTTLLAINTKLDQLLASAGILHVEQPNLRIFIPASASDTTEMQTRTEQRCALAVEKASRSVGDRLSPSHPQHRPLCTQGILSGALAPTPWKADEQEAQKNRPVDLTTRSSAPDDPPFPNCRSPPSSRATAPLLEPPRSFSEGLAASDKGANVAQPLPAAPDLLPLLRSPSRLIDSIEPHASRVSSPLETAIAPSPRLLLTPPWSKGAPHITFSLLPTPLNPPHLHLPKPTPSIIFFGS